MLVIQAAKGEGSGHPSKPQPPPSTAQPTNEEPIPTVVSSSHQNTQTPRQALKEVTELPQTSKPIPNVPDEAVYEEWDDRVGRATTTPASLNAAQPSGGSPRCQKAMGGSIAQTRSEKVPTQSYDSPLLKVNTLGSDEVSMTLHELTVLCTQLSNKVESLETELKQTKQTYGAAFTKLIKKVKKYSGRHGQEMEFETEVYTAEDVSTAGVVVTTGGASISTASPPRVSTAEDISTAETLVYNRMSVAKDKGKAKMDESEPEQTKIKLQQRQERAGYEAAVRLQEQLDEEERRGLQVSSKRMPKKKLDQGSAKRQKTSEYSSFFSLEEQQSATKYPSADWRFTLIDLSNELENIEGRKNTSIGARDARFGRGTQANEDAQGYLRRNHPTGVTP
ncbi:hypothetical protein Tco_0348915 [Tanacetum coccineum]